MPTKPETTQLSPLENEMFQRWVLDNQIGDLDHPQSFYDYRGFWKEHPDFKRAPGQHLTDKFKQHGHPTFSVESQYSLGPDDGGTWQGDNYVPPQDLTRSSKMANIMGLLSKLRN